MDLSKLTFSHFREIQRKGYTLDMLFILNLIVEEQADVKVLCQEVPKIEAIYQGIYRKGLVTTEGKLTLSGKELIKFLETQDEEDVIIKKKPTDDAFSLWWKTYPGTDTFVHSGKSFSGSRNLRAKKDDCKIKLDKILEEGEYTIEELVEALAYEVVQKKENSVKTGVNRMTYMQNSLTYLNQRTFEPFIELIKEGVKIETHQIIEGSTDI
jgi:hypothetical protein